MCPEEAVWTTVADKTGPGFSEPLRWVFDHAETRYDRVVIEIAPTTEEPIYLVKYGDDVRQEGRGNAIELAGIGKWEVTVFSASYDLDSERDTFVVPEPESILDPRTFAVIKQVALGGSFEGQSTFGIGVEGKYSFRVLADVDVDGTGYMMIDIVHQ
ncbi:MAG: hypothetical protein ABI382_09430 [Nakamurella sp.]